MAMLRDLNPLRHLLSVIWVIGSVAFASDDNDNPEVPPPPYGPYPPSKDKCCEECMQSDGGSPSQCADLPSCSSTSSVYFSFGLGRTPFERKTSFVRSAVIPTYGVALPSLAHTARSFEETMAYYRQSPLTARREFKVWMAEENITASAYSPSALKYDEEALSEKIVVSGALRQVLTDDRFADIQAMNSGLRNGLPDAIKNAIPSNANGILVRVWFAGQQGAKSGGLYGLPSGSGSEPVGYIVFYNPNGTSNNGNLNIIHHARFSGSFYKTWSICHSQNPSNGNWITTRHQGLPTDSVIQKTTLVRTAGSNSRDFTWTRTEQEASISIAGTTATFGALQTISVSQEDYDDIGGVSRLVQKVEGYGSAAPRTTRYGWFNNPATSVTHGRLKWVSRPDGSFEYYDYNFDVVAGTGMVIKKTPWKDYKWDPLVNPLGPADATCLIESTLIDIGGGIYRLRSLDGQVIADEKEHWSVIGDGTLVHTIEVRYSNSSGDVLKTVTGYHPSSAPALLANRIKWREFPDGTAEAYEYDDSNSINGSYDQIVYAGAGDRNGITAGTKIFSTRNKHGITVLEERFHFDDPQMPIVLELWYSVSEDIFGRPTKRVWNGDPDDYDETNYGCCGIASFRDRQGIVTDYFQDDIKRIYKKVRTAGSHVVTTTTGYSGLVTETRRKSGSLDLLVSKTWRLLNGEMEKIHRPDEDNDSDPEETTYAYSYPGTGGRIVTVTNADGGTEITECFTDGQIKSKTGTAVADTLYDYGKHAHGVTGNDVNGGGLWTEITRLDSESGTDESIKNYFDLAGRLVKTVHPDSARSTTSYFSHTANAGSRGKPYQSTDPDGVVKTFAYDAEGNRSSVTEAMPGSVGNRVTTFAHSAGTISGIGDGMIETASVNGVEVERTEQGGTGYASISTERLSRSTLVQRSVISDDAKWTESTRHPDNTLVRDYYVDGRKVATTRWEAGSSLPADAPADITAVATAGFVSGESYTYDGLNRLATRTDSRTGTVSYNAYTESGNLLSETDAGSRTITYTYDAMGRRTAVDQPNTAIHGGTANNITRTSYYPTGQIKAVWGDQTYATFRIYDEQHRLTELRTYRSHAHGTEPTSATSGYDQTTWIYHAQRGWLVRKEYADGKGPDYGYTAAGRLKTRTWARGKHTRFDYRQGFLVAKRYFTDDSADTGANAGNDPVTPDVGYSYNNFGQPVAIVTSATSVHPGTRIFYIYHSAIRRVISETQQIDPDYTFYLGASDPGVTLNSGSVPASITRVVHHKADGILRDAGADLRHTLYATSTLDIGAARGYDANDGRLTLVTGDFSGSTATFDYSYIPRSNSDLIGSVSRGTQVTTNTWQGDRDALDDKENKVGSTVISKYAYGVNAIGQRDSVTATGTAFSTAPNWSWEYNARGELVSSQHLNTAASSRYYAFDAIGNRTQHRNGTHTSSGGSATTYTPDQLNQYDAIGTLATAYDDDGNMTTGPLPVATGLIAALGWNGENQLHEVTPSGGSVVKYHYDALGRRVAKTEGSNRTYWMHDGWNQIAEYTGAVHTSGTAPAVTLQKTWLWGTDLSGMEQGAGGVGGLLAMNQETGGNAGIYHALYDGNGNIAQYVSNSGSVVADYEYDGFGRTLVGAGTHATLFPHRFSTKYLDGETGFYYYGYRYYDSHTGRWPSRDPLPVLHLMVNRSILSRDIYSDSELHRVISEGRRILREISGSDRRKSDAVINIINVLENRFSETSLDFDDVDVEFELRPYAFLGNRPLDAVDLWGLEDSSGCCDESGFFRWLRNIFTLGKKGAGNKMSGRPALSGSPPSSIGAGVSAGGMAGINAMVGVANMGPEIYEATKAIKKNKETLRELQRCFDGEDEYWDDDEYQSE